MSHCETLERFYRVALSLSRSRQSARAHNQSPTPEGALNTTMDLQFKWLDPMPLVGGSAEHLTYRITNEDDKRLSEVPGIYILGRRHGVNFSPMYVGRAGGLRSRIWQQFTTNIKLMN